MLLPSGHDIEICRDLCTFWKSWAKKVPFLVQNSVYWAKSALLHGIIAHYTELILLDLLQKL